MSSVFALLSSIFFAGNAVCVRLALRGSTAATATIASVLTNIGALWLLAAFTGSLSRLFQPASLIFLAAGAFAPAFARLTYYESINIIGVARASTLSNTTPIFTAMLAVPILHEQMTWRLLVGTLMVVAGVALAVKPEDRKPAARSAEVAEVAVPYPEPAGGWIARFFPASLRGDQRRTLGILLALNTAVMASISFLLRKTGLGVLPDPTLAAALTVTGSLMVLLPFQAMRSRRDPLRTDRNSLTYLVAGGLLTTAGFLSYFLALSLGDIVRVTPLGNTTPIFAVGLLYMFRQIEKVAPNTALGAVLTVVGILFVVGG
ncbi:MAG: DMT family transporter [bacterium]